MQYGFDSSSYCCPPAAISPTGCANFHSPDRFPIHVLPAPRHRIVRVISASGQSTLVAVVKMMYERQRAGQREVGLPGSTFVPAAGFTGSPGRHLRPDIPRARHACRRAPIQPRSHGLSDTLLLSYVSIHGAPPGTAHHSIPFYYLI